MPAEQQQPQPIQQEQQQPQSIQQEQQRLPSEVEDFLEGRIYEYLLP